VELYLCSLLYVSVAMTGRTLRFLHVIHFGAQWLKIKLGGEIFEYSDTSANEYNSFRNHIR
jgi:hypothetical protein